MFSLNLEKIRWPYREDSAFAILSFIVLFVPLVFGVFTIEGYETVKFIFWLVFFGLTIILWVRQKLQKPAQSKVRINVQGRLIFIIALILFFALVSAIFAPDKWYSFFGFYYRFTNSFGFFALWSLTFLLLCDLLNPERLKFLFKILAICSGLVAVKAILESVGLTLYQGPDTAEAFLHGSPSFLGNSNFSSMFMAVSLPLVIYLWAQTKKFSSQIFYGLNLFVITVALAILASRGAFFGLGFGIAAALLLLVVSGKSLKKPVLLKIILASVVFLFLTSSFLSLSRPGFANSLLNQDNVTFRLQVWNQALTGALQHPLQGIGLGNFAIYHERLARPGNFGVFDDTHNLWIFLLSTGGLPFGLLFLALVAWAFFKGFLLWRRKGDFLIFTLLCSLVIFVISASFTPVPLPCFLFLAVLLAGIFLPGDSQSHAVNFKPYILKVLAVFGAVFIIWGGLLLAGETALRFGSNSYAEGNFPSAYRFFRFSAQVDPINQQSLASQIQAQIRSEGTERELLLAVNKLKSIHPKISTTYVMAADAHFQMYAKFNSKEFLNNAIADMKQALAIDPSYGERYGQAGFYYFLEQDYDSALINLEQSLKLKPGLLQSLILEARIYQIKQDWPKMASALEQAYVSHPEDSRVRTLRYMVKRMKNLNDLPMNIYYSPR